MHHTMVLMIAILLLTFGTKPLYATSADTSCGIIWDEPILLSDTNYNAHSPKIALSGEDTVHVTWRSQARIGHPDLRLPYVRSVNGGASIEPTRELLPDSVQHPYNAITPHVVATGAGVYVFFTGSAGLPSRVHMIKSGDGGMTWGSVHGISPDSASSIQSVAIREDTISLVYPPPPATRKILRSTNGGQSWTRTDEGLDYFARIALSAGGVLHLVQRSNTGAGETEYKRSHDLGDTWVQTEIISTIDNHSSADLAISAEDTLLVAAWRDPKYGCLGPLGCSIITRKGMVRGDSTVWDIERTATEVPRGFAPAPSLRKGRVAVAWVADLPAEVYHASVRVTREGDSAWCPEMDLTPTTEYKVTGIDAALSAEAVHVVWEQSVAPDPSTFRIFYRRGRFVTTGVDEQEEHPTAALLEQNYPNPFNASTHIPFRVTGEDRMSLKVYDVLGRQIAVLMDEKKNIGEYSVAWNAEDLPSGVYYYRLVSGGRIETKKAILLK